MDATGTRHTTTEAVLTDLLWVHGRWLALPLGAGLVVYAVYLYTHPYPAFGAGLFLLMAEQIAQAGYHLPAHVPYYTAEGVPLAYPPLAFYAAAALLDVGVDPLTLTRLVPGLLTVLYLVPAYLLGVAVLDSEAKAAFAATLVAASPAIFQWHIGAGGFVRATAFLLLLAGLAAGARLFRGRNAAWLAPATACFALTILSHPKYIVFYVLSYVLFWAVFDRSVEGLANGTLVGVGGVVLTAPWWGQVIGYHGADVFFRAAGTHREVGNVLLSLETLITFRYVGHDVPWFLFGWRILPVVAAAWLTWRRRWFLPTWLAATAALVGESRFFFLVGALNTATFLFDGVGPALRSRLSADGAARVMMAVLLVVAGSGLAIGSAYAASELNAHAGTATLPQYLDDSHVEAMAWVREGTDPDAEFVVLGDAGEWFPYFTHRTNLVGPWGVEWRGDRAFRRQTGLFVHTSHCPWATCLTAAFARNGVHPDYLYVSKGEYTVKGATKTRHPALLETLRASSRYEVVYENDGVAIFRVDDSDSGGQSVLAGSASVPATYRRAEETTPGRCRRRARSTAIPRTAYSPL